MALFRSDKRSILQRLKNRDWRTPEHREELLQELLEYELKLSDLSWMLGSRERVLRSFALQIISQSNDPTIADELIDVALESEEGSRTTLYRVIVDNADSGTISRLQGMLNSDKMNRRDVAVGVLLTFPPEDIRELFFDLLRHSEREVRLRALRKVIDSENRIPERTLRRHLLALARDPEERIRALAIQTLADNPDDEVLDLLCERLRVDSYAIKRTVGKALDVLAEAKDSRLMDRLVPLLSAGDFEARDIVFRILFKAGDPTEFIRRVILYSRTLMGWIRERIHQTISAFGEEVLDPVIQLMSSPEEDIRNAALIFATHFKSDRLVEPLIALTSDVNWWSRIIALETLAQYEDERVVDVLIGCLEDEEVRWSAIEALAKIGSPRALGPIARLLRDSVVDVRREVVRALEAYNDPRALPLLEQCFKSDPSLAVREQALGAYRSVSKKNQLAIDEAALLEKLHAGRGGRSALERLLVKTRRCGASDLHLSPDTEPVIRLNGELRPLGSPEIKLTADQVREMVADILTEDLRQRFKTERQLDLCHEVPDVGRYRVNIFQEMRGVAAAFRVIPNEIPDFEFTGLPSFVMDIANYNQGLVIICGPAGAGKTTTLAALVNLFNERRHGHILTIEDPIEFLHPYRNCLVNQRGIGSDTKSFPAALRAALREDPDVVIVGEMRDLETCRLAFNAAETGHVVIGTMQTSSATKALRRLIDIFPTGEKPQVRSSVAELLKLVICQTLVPARVRGRVPCHEILVMTRGMAHAVREERDTLLPSLIQMGRGVGMQHMDDGLMRLYRDGLITAEEAYLRAEKRELFEPFVSETFIQSVYH